jgi:chloride channel protein, CIC family
LALPIGALAAFITLGFRELLQWLSFLLFAKPQPITLSAAHLPWYGLVLLVNGGGLLAGFILKFAVKLEKAQAIPTDYLEVINSRLDAVPTRASLLRACSSIASIGSGASVGKEGPMVQITALAGSLCRRLLPVKLNISTIDSVAMAATAGLAAVYHAPLAAALFISEIAFGTFAVQRVIPLILAAGSGIWFCNG